MVEQIGPIGLLGIILAYFLALVAISYFTSKEADNDSFFLADRKSPWILVAIGMVGASLSGVTFISVPGKVGTTGLNQAFSYLQVVFGYLLGYLFIALVLLPLYYRLQLTSIYQYLEERLGWYSYKTGAFYFLLSRILGASFRLYVVAIVLQGFILGPLGVPFIATIAITILLIWIYTFRGGIKTIVWTDTLQTICMLAAVLLTIFAIGQSLELSVGGMVDLVRNSDMGQVFFFEGGWSDPNNFFKQFLGGALITIVMTGLDQDMMQKNLSMPNVRDAQKNVLVFSLILVVANTLFLFLGAILYLYAYNVGLEIPVKSDELFPMVALQHLGPVIGVVFLVGLIAAAYSSADSALTALTTSFCIDFLDFEKKERSQEELRRLRRYVHIGFSIVLLVVIYLFHQLSNQAIIDQLLTVAGYTYGPLLGLFTFGLFTRLKVREVIDLGESRIGPYLPNRFHVRIPALFIVCILAPLSSFLIDIYSSELLYGFQFGFLILALNGLLTFMGLLALSYRDYGEEQDSSIEYGYEA